jgi:DNA-binding SARP family transcriptional activator
VRRLATLRSRQNRIDDAQGLLVRLLVVDPYDEQVHRMLVRTLARAGRHGEARRAFRRWRDAMRAIDAPLPDPALMQADPPRRPPTTPMRRPRLVPGPAL